MSDDISVFFVKWWEKYPELNSAKFTWENSGNAQHQACPYQLSFDYDGLELSPGYDNDEWEPVGYTLNPPFGHWDRRTVGIMFEKKNGDQAWFHYPIQDEKNYK